MWLALVWVPCSGSTCLPMRSGAFRTGRPPRHASVSRRRGVAGRSIDCGRRGRERRSYSTGDLVVRFPPCSSEFGMQNAEGGVDQFVLHHRPPKNLVDPFRPYATAWEEERG